MTTYKRQYRSTPRHPSIQGSDLAKCMALVVGFVVICWVIVFG